MRKNVRVFFTLLCLCCGLGQNPAYAQDGAPLAAEPPAQAPAAAPDAGIALPMHEFARLPVLHEGRIKPLDSLARILMRQIAGDENPHGRDAVDWLALVIFDPARAAEQPLLKIDAPALYAQADSIPEERKRKFYSLSELSPLLQKTAPLAAELSAQAKADLTPDQAGFLAAHENAAVLTKALRSLSLILPLDVTLPRAATGFGAGETLNYVALSRLEMPMVERLQAIIKAKGEDPERYSDEEKKEALLAFQLQTVRNAAQNNDWLKIIPGQWQGATGAAGGVAKGDSADWFAPWELVDGGHGSPAAAQYLAVWEDLALAYRGADMAAWTAASAQAKMALAAQGDDKNLYQPARFALEILYNTLHPYEWARGLYVLGAILMGLYVLRTPAWARPMALGCMGLAMAAHIFGITARVILLDRPPVGTLYESVLFVALVCALSGWLAALLRRQDMAALAAAIGAFGLLIVAPAIVPEGETLEVLVAVLNTNFWLATHVTIITAGYGMCVLAAVMAHFYMGLRLRLAKGSPRVSGLYKAIYKVALIALLLTAVGTVLGGIWADQSWGRFWGWDPKENGALLIVLWLVWLLHGRVGGKLRDLSFMAGMAWLNVIVALAWFGVNLLSVGLHSYGFTSGIALGLGLFCGVETALIAALWVGVRYNEKKGRLRVA